ncbi:TolC family protein [Sulfurimonas marina]|uniref:TolC family protein n=1 Tax=Sulfurimonas marina TaxID=2590551 RepID=A0A7M1AVE2_9BACT|nr:TolC family protein [Sulfurimonas marina]QOP41384.1 TolC family protein [Sulfurimonas marina]
MKKTLLLLSVPLFLYSESLKDLIVYAKQNNDLLQSKSLQKDAKSQELESSKSAYFPTLDLGANYQRNDDPQPFSPGTTYSGYAKLSLDLYSGGAKYYTQKQKEDELSSSSSIYEASKKSLALQIVQNFYTLKSLEATLIAREEAAKAVNAQLQRIQRFFEAGLSTSDDVDRLQSAYDKNIYAIESLKFEILSLKKQLQLQVGKDINGFEASSFKKLTQESEQLDSIEALKYQKSSIINGSETIDSYYYPQVKLEDTYSVFGYQDKPLFNGQPIPLLDNQNTLMLSANIRLFDFGMLGEQKEALVLQAKALESEIAYKTKEQEINIELSYERIKTAKLNITSAASALKASKSALKTITEKYNHKIVDNVVYLDALSSHTEAEATYNEALNNLEVAYALYYFYNGKNLEEFLNE